MAPADRGKVRELPRPKPKKSFATGSAVVRADFEDRTGVALRGGLEAGVAVHHPLGDTGGAGAVEPERRRVSSGRSRRSFADVIEVEPGVGRDGFVTDRL